MKTIPYRYYLPEEKMPKAWYNLAADLPVPLPPPLHPGTGQPLGPDDLAPIFPQAVIAQEMTSERWVDIPEPVRDVYRLWRPAPLIRARRLEKDLHEAVIAFIKREFGKVTPENTDRAIFALYDAPLGIIRRYLSNSQVPPATVADLLRETYNAVMPKAKSR